MRLTLEMVLGLSILIAGLISIIRFKHINRVYYPFVYCIWIACANEALSFLLISNLFHNTVNNNIYVLLEAIFITWLFKRLKLFKKTPTLFYCLLTAFCMVWAMEVFILSSIKQVAVYFRVFYSFLLVLMSVHQINTLITTSKGALFKNATFLLCVGFIIYFMYKVFIEAFFIYGLESSIQFQITLFSILTYINLFSNLLYALAVLWMPKRQAFTLPS
jgi:hypothetical protein